MCIRDRLSSLRLPAGIRRPRPTRQPIPPPALGNCRRSADAAMCVRSECAPWQKGCRRLRSPVCPARRQPAQPPMTGASAPSLNRPGLWRPARAPGQRHELPVSAGVDANTAYGR
eukprot:311285-Alexandrium_andersonii.AAC.1